MTEEEWLRCNHWRPMLDHLGDGISRRKGMLYLCAGLRDIWHLLYSQWSREAAEVAEQFADGNASDDDLHSARYDAEGPTFGYDFQASFIRGHQTHTSRDVLKLIEMGIYRFEEIELGDRLGDPQVVDKLSDAAEITYRLRIAERITSVPNRKAAGC
jgi:hypothetical protein